jgi:ectoine hydroxylase-related dioxygenase (phytanoyl-CoA dioxygenase family)
MVTVRLHLDDCGADNGPLRVIPGSHAQGILMGDEIAHWRKNITGVACEVPRGGVLLMRPLILHASSSAKVPGHRRVIHLEYAAGELPGGLEWAEAQP